MLTGQTRVQIRAEGGSIAIEDLKISDLVYNPLTQEYVEIIDILHRRLMTREGGGEHLLHSNGPIEIPEGAISSGRPAAPLVVSSRQMICLARKFQERHPPRLECVPAQEVPGAIDRSEAVVCGAVDYYAIFFETPQIIVANKALVQAYDPSVFAPGLPEGTMPQRVN
jgi:hypothetical protein